MNWLRVRKLSFPKEINPKVSLNFSTSNVNLTKNMKINEKFKFIDLFHHPSLCNGSYKHYCVWSYVKPRMKFPSLLLIEHCCWCQHCIPQNSNGWRENKEKVREIVSCFVWWIKPNINNCFIEIKNFQAIFLVVVRSRFIADILHTIL